MVVAPLCSVYDDDEVAAAEEKAALQADANAKQAALNVREKHQTLPPLLNPTDLVLPRSPARYSHLSSPS